MAPRWASWLAPRWAFTWASWLSVGSSVGSSVGLSLGLPVGFLLGSPLAPCWVSSLAPHWVLSWVLMLDLPLAFPTAHRASLFWLTTWSLAPVSPKTPFIQTVETICASSCPIPKSHPFIFEATAAAATHNKTILSSHNHHLGSVIDAYPMSSIAYGSEFRPIHQLEPLLSQHPYWPKLASTLSSGSHYPLLGSRTPEDRTMDLEFFHTYNNHKSASSDIGIQLATDLLHSDVHHERALPLPIDYIDHIIGSELCPLGIAEQHTINDRGEIINKHRACHDHTYAGPSGTSLNLRTNKDSLVPCQYGHCLRRVLHYIHFLRLSYPTTPIMVSKTDLDAAYRRMHPIWHLAVQCICFISGLAYLLLRLPFGAAAAPAEFCVASEITCDVANNLLLDPSWEPDTTTTEYHHLIPAPIAPLPDAPFATARPLDVHHPVPLPAGKCDVYIDDIITVGLFIPSMITRLSLAAAVAIYAIFRPVHPIEKSIRNAVLSLRKLSGDGALCETKVILGWLVDTRAFLLSLPPDKFTAWAGEIHRLLANKFITKKELHTLVGRLNHVSHIIPLARHFLHRLRRPITTKWNRHTRSLTKSQQADLHLWLDLLSIATRGVSINLLTYRQPDLLCWSDASLTGMGGYTSTGLAWRWEIPLALRGRLTLNSLEYAASIVTIQLSLNQLRDSVMFPCILSILDSTSAIGWLHKSSFDETSQSIQSELARHLALMMLNNNSCLYSQHIPGETNVIADSLSRDFHIPSDTLSRLIRSHFQVHPSFNISPLPEELECWLTSLMRKSSTLQESKQEHTPSATWLGADGFFTFTKHIYPTTPSSMALNLSTGPTYFVPLCKPSATEPTPKERNASRAAPPERPLTTWLRNFVPMAVPTPAPTSPEISPS